MGQYSHTDILSLVSMLFSDIPKFSELFSENF